MDFFAYVSELPIAAKEGSEFIRIQDNTGWKFDFGGFVEINPEYVKANYKIVRHDSGFMSVRRSK